MPSRHASVLPAGVGAIVAFAATLCALPITGAAQSPIELHAHQAARPIGPSSLVLIDDTAALEAEAVAGLPEARFSGGGSAYPNFGFTRSVIWIRFTLRSASATEQRYVLDAAREWVDEVDLYEVEEASTRLVARSGSRVALPQRPAWARCLAMVQRVSCAIRGLS